MTTRWFSKCGAAVVVLSVVVLACGKHTPLPPKAPAAPVERAATEVHERVVPHTCSSRTKLAQLLGRSAPAPAPPPDQSAESAAPPTSVTAGSAVTGNEAYRLVAPGTVLIRSEHGMGTGVVFDPKGYVLTNYHVVKDGEQKDFVVTVQVTFGDLTPTGRMSRQEKTYEGVVVKADPVRDMAIVRVLNPPPKLTVVKLAKSAPQIGEKVLTVGHAGIGFLWAAKSCNVASVGERQQDTSILAAFECTRVDPSQPPEAAATNKKACEERKKRVTEAFAAETQGLAVQTDCAITHGDSGGALVNGAGEMVGLNQSLAVDLATASFHVHLDEIRDFTQKHGEEGVAILPDPLCDGGVNTTLEDLDLDGVPDTLVSKGLSGFLGSFDRMSFLIDLDQDHFKKPHGPLDSFDTEIALLSIRDTTYVWYDTDGDSRFDLLLVDKKNDGKPEHAYRLDAEGHAKEDASLLPEHDIDAKLIKDKTLHARLGKIASVIGGARYTSPDALMAASRSVTLPDPLLGGGTEGRVVDTDGNGKADTVFVHGAFSRGMLIDANEDSLGSLKTGETADELIKAKKIKAEIAVVIQGSTVWALYDTDNDSKFDLALMTTAGADPSWLYATNAFRLGAGGEMTPAPDQMGRKVLRPTLVSYPRAVTAFRGTGFDIAADDGAGSLPDPRAPQGHFHFRDLKGFAKGTVIEALSFTSSVMLIDLDRVIKLPLNADPEKVVNDPNVHAEVAVVHRGSSDWIYYDTDGDNKFDLVLFSAESGKPPTQAYRLLKNANAKGGMSLEVDSKSVGGRPFRYKSMFKDKAMAAKWKAIAGKLYIASSIEE